MSSEVPERRLAAILSADVAGYSRLMAEDEDATVRTLRAWRTQVGELITEHRGRLADFTGDNFLAEFPAARDAVECALEIQRVVAARNAALPEARRMRFRIGAHLGDVRHEDGRLFGDGVNVAARLQPLAEPGGLCLSAMLVEAVRGQIALGLEDIGEQTLKNLPNPAHAFRVRVAAEAHEATKAPTRRASKRRALALGGAALIAAAALGAAFVYRERIAARLAPTSVSALTPIRSIAVLPLANLSGDPEQEYFADGMTETLIAELAKLPGVRVISRTSVMQFKGTKTPLPEIAKLLNVDGVIEGSVMRAGNEVRITAQLVDARSDQHVWAEQYDRELARVLEIQSEVARAVAGEIRLALTPQQVARLAPPKPLDPRAHDAYLRGLARRDADDLAGAIRHLDEAVQLAPEYAAAWASLSRAHATSGIAGGTSAATTSAGLMARRAAQEALALDSSLADSHVAMGWVHLLFDWDWAAAELELRAAAELPSADPLGYRLALAHVLLCTGRRDEAIAGYERWFAETPPSGPRAWNLRSFLMFTGQPEQLLTDTTRDLEVSPTDPSARSWQATAFELLGRYEDAARSYARALPMLDGFGAEDAAVIDRGWRDGGSDGYLRAWESVNIRHSFWVDAAGMAALRGDRDAAFAHLERAYEGRDPAMRLLVITPYLTPLHSDPRFADLARRMNLPVPKP